MLLSKLPFAQKVSLLVTVMIVISGVCITGAAAYQFRRELYAQEYSSAFTVYMAAANYLSAHYKTHRNSYTPKSLDYVFTKKFLLLEGEQAERITHRPSRLAIYDGRGVLVYEYAGDKTKRASNFIAERDLPTRYYEHYDSAQGVIRVAGLISPDGDVPGFVFITFPTDIRAKIQILFRNTVAVMLAVILVAIAISSWMTSRALRPVESLIQAAKRVRRGDLDQHVIIAGEDEIGLLATTFNDMVGSLGRRIALMHRMQAWTMELGRIFDTKPLYESLMDVCAALSPAESFCLYMRHEKTGALDLVRRQGEGDAKGEGECDRALLERSVAEGRTRYVEADGSDVLHPDRPVGMVIPLTAGNKQIGAIWIGRPREGAHYDDETITILQTMAQHAAAAIDNVRLYNELSEKERYEREMALARQIQAGMLPREVPCIEGYEIHAFCRPAFEVGGDYYDYIRAEDGRWRVVIGDVSGKGVPAAMIVSIVRTLMHTCVQFESSTPRVLKWVNRNLSPDLKSDMFVTLSVITLDGGHDGVKFLRAGHEPGVLVRRDGRVERVAPEGTALGLLELNTFEKLLREQDVPMAAGDTLLLYTDGIIESLDRDDHEFGHDRLADVLQKAARRSPREMVDAIVQSVDEFAAGCEQHDDMTVIAIRRV